MLTYKAFILNESQDDDTPKYFITIGQRAKMYTLRVWRTEYDSHGNPYEKDYHVATLAKDKEEAIQKAIEKTGLKREQIPVTDIEVGAHAAADKEKHFKFPNGKYEGLKLEEVDDTHYKMWWYNNYFHTPSYIKFIKNLEEDLYKEGALVKVTDELREIERKTNEIRKKLGRDEYYTLEDDTEYITTDMESEIKQQYESWKSEENKKERLEKSKFIGTVGEKIQLELHLNYIGKYNTQWGSSNIYNMQDKNGNIFIKFGTISDKFFVDDNTIKATCEIKDHNTRWDNDLNIEYKQTILGRFTKYE